MNLKELVDILKMKPGYLKSGPSRVSSKFEVEEKIALEAIREAKKLLKQARLGLADNSNDNESVITEFESYLKKRLKNLQLYSVQLYISNPLHFRRPKE